MVVSRVRCADELLPAIGGQCDPGMVRSRQKENSPCDRCFLILTLLALAAPAWPRTTPMIHPSRDVAVEYRSSGTPHGPAAAPGRGGDDAVLQQERPHPDRWCQWPRLRDSRSWRRADDHGHGGTAHVRRAGGRSGHDRDVQGNQRRHLRRSVPTPSRALRARSMTRRSTSTPARFV